MDNYRKILLLATNMRTAIENLDGANLGHKPFKFPIGCCGDAAILLGEYFQESGFGDFEYICGMQVDQTHAWIEKDGLIVDITGDQFPNGKRVYAGGMNAFYRQFEVDTRHPWNDILDGNTINDDRLSHTYQAILHEIDRMAEVVSGS